MSILNVEYFLIQAVIGTREVLSLAFQSRPQMPNRHLTNPSLQVFILLICHREVSDPTIELDFFPASLGDSSQPHESSGDFSYLELDKWIRHCLIAKRRRQLLSDAESPATSSENDLWDRLLDLRVQVYTYVADFISMVTNHRLSRQRRSLLAMESRELAA